MADNAFPVILAENIYELGTPVATDTASGYDAANIKDRRTYTFWQAASAGTKYLTIDCLIAVTADALGIVSHNLSTCAATISVECSSDNFATDTTVALAGFTVTHDKALLKLFTSVSKRYWRIKIIAGAIAPKIAVAFLGDRVTFPRTYLKSLSFDPAPEKIIAESTRSKTGVLLGNVLRYVSRTITWTFAFVLASWIESTFRGLWDDYLSQLKPVFMAWEITNHPTETFYGKIPDDFQLTMPYDVIGRRTITLTFEVIKE